MEMQLSNRITKRKEELGNELILKLSHIANICSSFWHQSEKLDAVLLASRKAIPKCKLLYAVECHGVQLSSNIMPDGTVDTFARGQNLSSRPYMLNKDLDSVFSLSPVYLSCVDRKPCITVMHQVINDKSEVVGCIAADFDIDDFKDNKIQFGETYGWRQIKGDPAIRQNLFQQERVNSAMDQQLDQVHDIIVNLVCKRGIFHAKLHYSSSRATLWSYERPCEYQLHVLDEIIDPDVCLAYPKLAYPSEAKVIEEKVKRVFRRLKDLRNADETIYLRSGSLNIINAMVGLNFSCDGSHYMSVDEFLEKSDRFWFGHG